MGPVDVAVDHEHRTPNPRADVRELLATAQVERGRGVREGLGVGLETPSDAVLDLLGRVRLVEHLAEEVLEEPLVVALPVVAVVRRPALLGFELLLEARDDRPLGVPRSERDRRPHVDDRDRALGMVGRDEGRPQGAAREPHEYRALGRRRLHHGQRVGRELALDV
jgi:hypothetical protein